MSGQVRVQVLKEMGYIDDDSLVLMKGRVACEINSGNELIATEIIFAGSAGCVAKQWVWMVMPCLRTQQTSRTQATDSLCTTGVLADLTPAEAVALLSALVFQEKSEAEPQLPPALAAARQDMIVLTLQAAELQSAAGLTITPEQFLHENLNFGLMEVGFCSKWSIVQLAKSVHQADRPRDGAASPEDHRVVPVADRSSTHGRRAFHSRKYAG